ncbi:outer membrane beta-barrel protein [Geothrix limicola]|nr:outer membrane beta-barrel protein [Geothrix limicola]
MNRFAIFPLAVALSLPLAAQSTSHPSFGFSAQLNSPLGELKDDTDKTLGAGASFLVQWDFPEGHAIRPRFDVNRFNVSTYEPSHSNYRESRDLTSLGLGLDYLYYLNGAPKGLYLTAGAGVTRWDLSYTTSDKIGNTFSSSRDTTKNTTSLGLAAGLGWQFTRVIGLEARFLHSPYKAFDLNDPTSTARTDVNRDGNYLQFAATFRW